MTSQWVHEACTLTFEADLDQDKIDSLGFPRYAADLQNRAKELGLEELTERLDAPSLFFGIIPPIHMPEAKAMLLLCRATWIAYDDIYGRSCSFGFRHVPELHCRMEYKSDPWGRREVRSMPITPIKAIAL